MKTFDVHFIDRQGYVFSREKLLGLTDVEAIVQINEWPLPRFCSAFEIWHGDFLVFRGVITPADKVGDLSLLSLAAGNLQMDVESSAIGSVLPSQLECDAQELFDAVQLSSTPAN